MGQVFHDLRYAARVFRKAPGFTVTITLILALGIAANTIFFSIADALLLRPLPVDHPEELVRFVHQLPGAPPEGDYRYPFYMMLRDRGDLFAGVLGQIEMNLAMRDGRASERIRVDFVTGNFFSLLGVRPLRGRTLTAEDERSAGSLPVVLSYAFWMRRFNAEPSVIGRTIWLQGRDAVVVGITPREFNGISVETSPDIRVPLSAVLASTSDSEWKRLEDTSLDLVARLRPGIPFAQAQAEFDRLWSSYLKSDLAPEMKSWERRLRIELQSAARGVSRLRSQFSSALIFLMAAACLLLLIVCANVAGLLLARSAAREREMAVRVAVGASRGRLIRQLLTESALLTFVGGTGGLLLAFALMPLITRAMPPIRHLDATSLPLAIRVEPDLRILIFSLLLSALAAVLFGLGPALQVARRDYYSSLKSVRATRRTGSHAVLIAQIAVSTLLLTAASLLLATLDRLRRTDAGFDRYRVVTFSVDPQMRHYAPEQARSLENRLMERVRALPGVEQVAIADRGVMRGTGLKTTTLLPGQTLDRNSGLNTSMNHISPDYFSTMGMRIVAGRNYRVDEPLGAAPMRVVVNQAFARAFFPARDPIGQKFGAKAEREIIGVVGDAKYRSLREPIPPSIYFLRAAKSVDSLILHVRTHVKPESIITPVQDIMRSLDPELPFYEIKTLAEEVDSSLWSERLVAALASGFAVTAALLTGIGIYGLLSYTVTQRTHEIGIRIALGAKSSNIINLVASHATAVVAAGITLGIAGSLAATHWTIRLLYGISPSDVPTLTAVAVFVVLVAALATAIPAARAISVEPAIALRQPQR